MGMFDFLSSEDPNTQAQIAMAAGLLGGRGSFNNILGGAVNSATSAGQKATVLKRQGQLDELQRQRFQLMLDEEARRKKQFDQQEAFRRSIPSPEMAGVQGALAGGGGPTLENAAKVPPTSLNDQLMFGALKSGALSPMDYLTAQRKEEALTPVAPGASLFNQRTGKAVFTNPKESEDKNIAALKMIYGEGTPEYAAALKSYGEKLTTHTPGVSVSYGAPVAGTDEKGNPIFFQPGKGGGPPAIVPGVRPPAKEIPASTRKDIAENTVALQKIDRALTLLQENPTAVGGKNVLPEEFMQRIDPKGVTTRAAIADIGSQKLHDRSGASVTINEAPRLKPFIPNVRDTPEAAAEKLKAFQREYRGMIQALQGGSSVSDAAAKPKGVPKSGSIMDQADAILNGQP